MKKILIADDEQPLRMLVRATLGENDYQVLEATDGNQALALAQAEHPDVLLLDVSMPGLSGFEVCEKLKSNPETNHIKVVMLTAWAQQSNREQGLAAGADHYLIKPFSPLDLLHLVTKLAGA